MSPGISVLWVLAALVFAFFVASVGAAQESKQESVEHRFERVARFASAGLLGCPVEKILVAWNGGEWDENDYKRWKWQEFSAICLDELPRPKRAVAGLIKEKKTGGFEIDVDVTDDPEEVKYAVEDVRTQHEIFTRSEICPFLERRQDGTFLCKKTGGEVDPAFAPCLAEWWNCQHVRR